MRRRIFLYIGNELCDLDDDSFVLLNWRREDLSSPATVQSSWSQTVRLPNTGNNAAILGNYYRLDRRTITGGGTGIYFTAIKRSPFRIYDTAGALLQSGYLKMEKATEQSFEVVLYGGLGGLMYALTYSNALVKMTLADLTYAAAGGSPAAASSIALPMTRATVNDAWGALYYGAPSSGTIYDVINFAPCLNGTTYPFKFDTNKAWLRQGSSTANRIPNIEVSKTVSGKTYRAYPDDAEDPTAVLLEMGQKHNEWEVQDLRCYCQRPVISLRALVDALRRAATAAGYTLIYDAGFYNDTMEYLNKVWVTLPFINRDKYTLAQLSGLKMADYLRGTATPADYLLAFAKTFGMVFYTEPDGTTIRLLLRDNFYTFSTEIDLTERIDHSQAMEVQPFKIGAHFYEFRPDKVEGAYAKDYEERFGAAYGRQLVDTGYDFDSASCEVMQGVTFAGCADVRDNNTNYFVAMGDVVYFDRLRCAQNYAFKFAFTDTVKWRLYYWEEGEEFDPGDSIEVTPLVWPLYSEDYANQGMWMDLPQMCDEGGKALDGSNVLLFYNGMVIPPFRRQSGHMIFEAIYKLSDDYSKMEYLNGGVPCWDASRGADNGTELARIPSFRRWLYSGNTMTHSLDFGDVLEKAVASSFTPGKGLYHNYWKAYVEDRLNVDTTVVRAWVDLSALGEQPGENLLRRLYYFGGSRWTLNAIENYSLTTLGPTLCEFVRVQDINAYTSGQYQI